MAADAVICSAVTEKKNVLFRERLATLVDNRDGERQTL